MLAKLVRHSAWVVLSLLLLGLFLAALTFDRGSWPRLVGDEATYLSQAESLAWDGDLRYERKDFERFVSHWGFAPEGLILHSSDAGATITFGKPAVYSVAIAPFLRLAPRRGAAIGNALYLTIAAFLAAMALRRQLGPVAALWVAAFIFASVAFAHVFWAHADLFLMCLSAAALSLVYGSEDDGRRRVGWAFLTAGALLALVALSRPLYLSLLLPAAIASGFRGGRRDRLVRLFVGGGLVLLLSIVANLAVRGSWTPYGGERMGFYSSTGFPAVDFPADAWSEVLAERPGTGSWVDRDKFLFHVSPRLFAYDAFYFVVGRNIGLLPYFLPGLLALVAFRPSRGRWALLLAVAMTAAGFFYLRAFNFYGGGGALANRYFLPVYPALWFVVARRRHWLWPVAGFLLAAPFLWPVWTAPRTFPVHPEGGLRYVSTTAQSLLPYETSLSHLKPAGREDVAHGSLWVKILSRGLRYDAATERFRQDQPAPIELLIGASRALPALELTLVRPASGVPTVGGAAVDRAPGSALGKRYRLELGRPTARHRMWWTFDDVYLYRVELDHVSPATGPTEFSLRPDLGG